MEEAQPVDGAGVDAGREAVDRLAVLEDRRVDVPLRLEELRQLVVRPGVEAVLAGGRAERLLALGRRGRGRGWRPGAGGERQGQEDALQMDSSSASCALACATRVRSPSSCASAAMIRRR